MRFSETSDGASWQWIVLILLLSISFAAASSLDSHTQLVAISLSIFLILKFEAERRFLSVACDRPTFLQRVAWYCLWVGLDARAFFNKRRPSGRVALREWSAAACKMVSGLVLLVVIAPEVRPVHELCAGWLAMLGLIFTLHFGAFHLVALIWMAVGRDVRPIMNLPLAATSLSEFWGQRWNLAFRDFAHVAVFMPLARRRGARIAHWSVFIFSGLIHEIAISIPARSGYGLPLAYFVFQGIGIAVEKRWPRLLGLQHPRGVLWTALMTAPAAYWLFHPAFVRRIILPLIGG